MMLDHSENMLSLWVALQCLSGTSVVAHNELAFTHDRKLEVQMDFVSSTQHACAKRVEYTSIEDAPIYTDAYKLPDQDSLIKESVSALIKSRVVFSSVPDSYVTLHNNMPIALAFSNIGLGLGITNGTPKAYALSLKTKVNPMLPLHHPRQNMSYCQSVAKLVEQGVTSFYESHRDDFKLAYLRVINNAILHRDGFVGLECGWLQPRQGCCSRVLATSRKWWSNTTAVIKASTYPHKANAWADMDIMKDVLGKNTPVYDEVFVIDTYWDFNYHHFLHESLTRLIRFYHFLKRNTHVMIHVMAGEDYFNTSSPSEVERMVQARAMRERVVSLLGFDTDRMISGQVLARQLYLPNDIECGSSFRHAHELRLLSKILLSRTQRAFKKGLECGAGARNNTVKISEDRFLARRLQANTRKERDIVSFNRKSNKSGNTQSVTKSGGKAAANKNQSAKKASKRSDSLELPISGARIVIQGRLCPINETIAAVDPVLAANTRPYEGFWRCLTQRLQSELVDRAEERFVRSHVTVAEEAPDIKQAPSLACDITMYRDAHLVIGLHGAAMTNVMFMKPGSILVEIVGEYDGRMMPICGIYGPLAAVYGVHHYIYYYDGRLDADSLDVSDVLDKVYAFYNSVRGRAPFVHYHYSIDLFS